MAELIAIGIALMVFGVIVLFVGRGRLVHGILAAAMIFVGFGLFAWDLIVSLLPTLA